MALFKIPFCISLFSIKSKVINTFKGLYIKRNIKKVSLVYTIQFILKLLIREVSYEALWFSFVLFSIDNEHIYKDFVKRLGLLYTIPFTFLDIMKALVLVEDLSTTGF